MPVEGREDPCGSCGRRTGDHTLDEWAACLGKPTLDLPYGEIPDDMAAAAAASIRKQFELDGDILIADGVVARAVTLDGTDGNLGIRVPGVSHEFHMNIAGQAPAPVAKILYLGETVSICNYGQLILDTANGASQAAAEGR